jgi:protein-S-isoprenylcysteine O-methyltransferase Ste14
LSEKVGGRGREGRRVSRHFTVRGGALLRKVLTVNLVILMGFAVSSFSVPLSDFERWFAVSTVTILAAVNLAAIEHLRTG